MFRYLISFFTYFIALSVNADPLSPINTWSENISGVSNNTQLPLFATIQGKNTQSVKKSFQSTEVEGWLQKTGDWYIKGVVTHSRLRCATYELGVRLGKGNPACLNVEWLSDISYGTSQQQCNSSPVEHVGGGVIPELATQLKTATCVQIVVKCTGACGQ